jgi:hypothetical protein
VTDTQRGPRDAAPNWIVEEARAGEALSVGIYRAVVAESDGRPLTHLDFTSLEEATGYADDVASEADWERTPPAAYVFDSDFHLVHEGRHYGSG